ncbi:MAG: inorganic phosphate transporter [Acidothermaceae bacterium]
MSTTASPTLLALALVFAVVTGANDGGAILTMGLRLPSIRPLGALVVLVLGVTLAPLLFGVHVAETFSKRLVSFDAANGRSAFVVGLCAALAVVAVLTRSGLPTSLTLALIGGITGAGLGYGLSVAWPGVLAVLAFGLAAPLAGGLAGLGLARALRALPADRAIPLAVRWSTLAGYVVQAFAYGANDGQKMLAVFAITGTAGDALTVRASSERLVTIGCCFAIGTVLSLRRLAGRLGRDLLVVRPVHALSAELASSAAVFGSAAAGMPVSMTQAIAGALVGAGVSESSRRVRWRAVVRLAMAWAVTLPATVVLAFVVAAAARLLR